MATLPDSAALGERLPVPQSSGVVAAYEPPNWRQTGMAGQYVSDAGRQVEQAANEMIHANAQQDQIVAQNAANQLEQRRIHDQVDTKTGWANAKQGQAVGPEFINTNTQRFNDAQQAIRDSLTSEYQKKVFDQHAQGQLARFQTAIFSHQAQETDKFNSTVENATINNSLAAMARDPANELEFQTDLQDINRTVEGALARRGLPASEGDVLKRQYLVAAYSTRIDSIARGVPGGAGPDPKKAQAMLAQVWDQLGSAGPKIWDSLQGAVNTIHAKEQGTAAFTEAVGSMAAPALPKNLGLPVGDRPFDQKRIDQIKSFVQTPSKWEPDILAAAQANGVNPAEIKLKIAIESGGNPQAVNPQGGHGDHATGLGQFMAATAKQYGVEDRNDPVQSIWGIARFLKAHGGTNGASMTAADQAYIGSGDASKQYVENTRAARQQAIGGGGGQTQVTSAQLEGLESQVIQNAERRAQVDGPNDPALRDKYVMEAHRNWSVALTGLKGKEYSEFTNVLDAAVNSGAQAQSDLPREVQAAYDQLPVQRRLAIDAQFDHNAKASRGEYTKSDARLVNDLTQRVYLSDGDPKKITNPGQLSEFMGKGLNYTDMQRLSKEITESNTPEGNPFLKSKNHIEIVARRMLTASAAMSLFGAQHPEIAEEAAYRFSVDLDNKIKNARAANQDPQTLFTPGSKDYVLDPNRVAGFMPTEAEIAARKAAAPVSKAPVPTTKAIPRLPNESPADYLTRTRS